MLKTVTLEDYAYDAMRRVLADPDTSSVVLFDLSKIQDAPADAEGQNALCEEFVTELRKLHPEWDIRLTEDVPDSAPPIEVGALAGSHLWRWVHIDKQRVDA